MAHQDKYTFSNQEFSDSRYFYDSSQHKTETSKLSCEQLAKGLYKASREFCLETSMHGFNHIAAPNRHTMERIIWIAVTAVAIWGAIEISLGQWQRFNDNPTVVALEKDFRTWQFPLPSITNCDAERVDPDKVESVIKSLWDAAPGEEKYEYYRGFVDTVANSHLLKLEGFLKYASDHTLEVDLFQLAVDVMPDLQVKASWSEPINPKWTPVMTEAGACYCTNSLAIADIAIRKVDANDTKDFPLTCTYSASSCYIILEIIANTSFYIQSPTDVMDITSPPFLTYLTLNKKSELGVLETRCGDGVRDLSLSRRGCLYVNEPVTEDKQVYSSSMCRRSCRNRFAVDNCGCKPFYNFYEEGKPCSTAGMACLSKYARELATLKCHCMLQCEDSVYKELSKEEQFWNKGPFIRRGSIRFTLQAPRTRYTREIVFHFQDLVVSFGGAAGLFLGASFLSFVEILYFIFERIIKIFIEPKKQSTPTRNVIPASLPRVPYELSRIKELNDILDSDRTLPPYHEINQGFYY